MCEEEKKKLYKIEERENFFGKHSIKNVTCYIVTIFISMLVIPQVVNGSVPEVLLILPVVLLILCVSLCREKYWFKATIFKIRVLMMKRYKEKYWKYLNRLSSEEFNCFNIEETYKR